MRAEEHRLATLACFDDAAAKFSFHQRIQPACRLVEHQQRRPSRECGDKGHLLPVAGRIGPGRLVEVEIETVDQLVAVGRVDTGADTAKQLDDFGARQPRPQRDIRRHVGDVTMGPTDVTGGATEYFRTACSRANQSEQQADRRRLAGTVGAQESEHLAGCDRQIQILDGHNTAEPLRQTVGKDGGAGSSARQGVHALKVRSGGSRTCRLVGCATPPFAVMRFLGF